jgi:hypothetical protein
MLDWEGLCRGCVGVTPRFLTVALTEGCCGVCVTQPHPALQARCGLRAPSYAAWMVLLLVTVVQASRFTSTRTFSIGSCHVHCATLLVESRILPRTRGGCSSQVWNNKHP